MRKANVRVEARDISSYASFDERERNFRNLLSTFRQACNKAGIMKEIKKLEFYESPAQITRRKKREKEANLLKLKMKESFIEKSSKKKKKKKKDEKSNGNKKR
jgi:ribosomal protein S21